MLISAATSDLCLAYANTLSWRGSEAPTEKLRDLASLLGWAGRAGVLDPAAGRSLARWSRGRGNKGGALFADAIALREALYRIFSAVAVGEDARERDLSVLTTALAKAPARRELARARGRYGWRVAPPRPVVAEVLAPILWSAADLLLDDDARIRRCANDKCLWLFIDGSKNGTRRWCDMASCGNRAKAQRHYAKIAAC